MTTALDRLEIRTRSPFCAAAVLLVLTACDGGSSADGNPSSNPPVAQEAPASPSEPPVVAGPDPDAPASVFGDFDAVVERFGTRTTRELDPDVDEATRAAVVRALNDFSFDLHRAIAGRAPADGSVESGYSAAVALTLASAATGGDTRAALAALLGTDALAEDDVHAALNALALALESRTNDDLVLRTANRVFVQPGLALRDDFLDVATADYGAPVTEADFAGEPDAVAEAVNTWVSTQTDGFIPTIIDRFDSSTVFALLNAIFLDAGWRDDYVALGERPFTGLDGTATEVASFGGRSELPRLVRDDLTALEIPYGGDELAMLILVPASLDGFEAALDADSLATLVGEFTRADVDFVVPNWEQSASLDLGELLAPLGLPANPWDFARLTEPGASLDVAAIQRARIEVDENGTRAAAVTLVDGDTSVPESIAIDRPFVYALRDRTSGTVLFTGRVVAP